jgi:hypothetical protein
MEAKRFEIIFRKIAELRMEDLEFGESVLSEGAQAELDEISQLRDALLEINEPEPTSYSST